MGRAISRPYHSAPWTDPAAERSAALRWDSLSRKPSGGASIPFTCTGVKMAVPLPKWGRSPCVQSFQRGSLRSRILWSSRLGVSFYIFESKGFTVRSRSLPSVSPPATTGERPGLYRSPQARRGRRRICCCTPPERFCVHTASVWGIEREFEL